MKSLVTGIAGFVGSTLAEELLSKGHEVVGIDCFTDYYDVNTKMANIKNFESDVAIVRSDINEADLDALLDGVDTVYHQAGQPGVRSSWGRDFTTYTKMNVDATQRLLEAAKKSSTLKRFVYASSSSVYGDAESYPTRETDRPMPVSPYGVTKLAAEHLCTLYAKNFGVPTVSLRYFTVYGPRQRPDMAFNKFIRAALQGSEIEIYGDGHQVRDFTYISDIVAANVMAGNSSVDPGTVLNVSGGSNVSIRDVLRILGEITGRTLNVNYGPPTPGDVRRTGGESEESAKKLGWRPSVQIEKGLELEVEYFAGLLNKGGQA
ncbi:NAD-dependent epimerase/dehydratase family protein [Rhodococcus rhodochrous]|uniref:NAD-dependent epimerase/dehydratase family protein n=1 Tax=Rhodococcus rhodochrous TaxID=1829 RepID=UPI001E480EFF|nr:NAD-dependent epimerase/dehydratase family protein [Rhodococcus rhodochrous]MCD2100065.1 GDP-mannose 4,6-dehydratase [Rhodococcus rhodochrous]MCD2124479.1 GDP-mannose 4,6-dehydratase [Rhodococcus rhodochrous]MCQ4137386.1 GDP-mannose 4,6-dehydratase [Rhodococcus rhodochrous]MDJ0021234.1 GDP-mannose 4,6-dehydratase [Rhodococcus rhodochrous]